MTRLTPAARSGALLLAAPLLLVGSLLVWLVSDALGAIGPFDRAVLGWGLAVPLLLLAPGAAALAGRGAGARAAAWLVAGLAVLLGALAIVGLLATATQIACVPVSGPLDVLPHAIPVALTVGLGFAVSAAAASRARSRGAVVALEVGAILAFAAIIATILVLAASFGIGASCGYVPPG